MSKRIVFAAALAAITFSVASVAVEDQGIPDDELGLSKTSVFDVPDPEVVDFSAGDPGTVGKRSERSYTAAPPMIPHATKDFPPISLEVNLCKDCHVQPALLGTKIEPGIPVPAPVSHYLNVKKGELHMARWNCTQCHREQANVKLLVESTFKAPGKKAP